MRKWLRPLGMIIWAVTAIKPRIYIAGTRRREYIFLVWHGDVVVGKQGMKSSHTSVKWPERHCQWVPEWPSCLCCAKLTVSLAIEKQRICLYIYSAHRGHILGSVDENGIQGKWLRSIPKKVKDHDLSQKEKTC